MRVACYLLTCSVSSNKPESSWVAKWESLIKNSNPWYHSLKFWFSRPEVGPWNIYLSQACLDAGDSHDHVLWNTATIKCLRSGNPLIPSWNVLGMKDSIQNRNAHVSLELNSSWGLFIALSKWRCFPGLCPQTSSFWISPNTYVVACYNFQMTFSYIISLDPKSLNWPCNMLQVLLHFLKSSSTHYLCFSIFF